MKVAEQQTPHAIHQARGGEAPKLPRVMRRRRSKRRGSPLLGSVSHLLASSSIC